MAHRLKLIVPLAAAFLFFGFCNSETLAADKEGKPDLLDVQIQVDEIEPLLKDPDTGLGAVGGKLDGLIAYASTNEADNAEMSDELESILNNLSAFKSEILAAVDAAKYLGPQITETTDVEWFDPDDMVERTKTLYIGPDPKRVSLRITGLYDDGTTRHGWNQFTPGYFGKDNWSVKVSLNEVVWKIFSDVNAETQDGYISYVIDLFEDKPISGTITLDYRRTLSDTYWDDVDPFIITFLVED